MAAARDAKAAAAGRQGVVSAEWRRCAGRKRKAGGCHWTTSRLLLEWGSLSSLSEVDGAVRTMVTEPGAKKQRTRPAVAASQRQASDAAGSQPATIASLKQRYTHLKGATPRGSKANNRAWLRKQLAELEAAAAAAAPLRLPPESAAQSDVPAAPAPAALSRPSVAAALLKPSEGQNCAASAVQEAVPYTLERGLDARGAVAAQQDELEPQGAQVSLQEPAGCDFHRAHKVGSLASKYLPEFMNPDGRDETQRDTDGHTETQRPIRENVLGMAANVSFDAGEDGLQPSQGDERCTEWPAHAADGAVSTERQFRDTMWHDRPTERTARETQLQSHVAALKADLDLDSDSDSDSGSDSDSDSAPDSDPSSTLELGPEDRANDAVKLAKKSTGKEDVDSTPPQSDTDRLAAKKKPTKPVACPPCIPGCGKLLGSIGALEGRHRWTQLPTPTSARPDGFSDSAATGGNISGGGGGGDIVWFDVPLGLQYTGDRDTQRHINTDARTGWATAWT